MKFHEAATLIGENAQAGEPDADERWHWHEPATVDEQNPLAAAMPTAAQVAPPRMENEMPTAAQVAPPARHPHELDTMPPAEPRRSSRRERHRDPERGRERDRDRNSDRHRERERQRQPEPVRAAEPAPERFIDNHTVQQRLNDESALIRRLERDPSDPVAGEHLEALYIRRGDQTGVVALLLDRAGATDDDDERAGLLVRASRIYRTELADLEAARVILITALAAAPGDVRVHDELDTVVCASGDFAAARAAYADAAQASAGNPALAGELWLRVASLHIMERGNPSAICAAFARVEAASPERVDAIVGLCERLAGELVVLDAIIALHRRLGDRAAES